MFMFTTIMLMPGLTGNYNFVKYGVYGLQNCQSGRCTSQIIEIILSVALIIWLIFEFVMQIRIRMRLNFSWQEVMLILIFLCLSFNICFMAWADIILWYVLQNLMYQFYFTTLVYYFTKKYFEKVIPEQNRPPYIIGLLVVYAIFCLSQLGIFIFMVNAGLGHCKEIAQLCINAFMICLGILFFILAFKNQREEKRKYQEFKVDIRVANPLENIWIWVIANIIGQIIREIESGLIYDYYNGQECYPIQDSTETLILGPIFMIFDQVMPFGATLWFYSQRRKQSQEQVYSLAQLQLSETAQVDVQNRILMIKDSTGRDKTGSLNQILI